MKTTALGSTALVFFLALTTRHDDRMLYLGVYSLAVLAIAVALLTLVAWTPKFAITVLSFTPLTWIGRISYGLYLWHWPVRGLVYGKSEQPAIRQIVAAIVLSFAIAGFSFYLIERPFLRWKRHFSHA